MSEFLSRYGVLLLNGTLESLYMTLVPTLLAYVIGLPLGVLLTVTKPGGFMETPQFNAAFGWLVNIFRSIPFMILMLFLTPFTRAVMGTSIGASAANLPLTVAAAPFVARMVEQSLEEVDGGVYLRRYVIEDDEYGEISIEFYANPSGFRLYYHS